jgi:proteasome accessory factor A
MTLGRELDWVAKYQLIEAYRAKHDLPLSHAGRDARPRLPRRHRDRGLYYLLERQGRVRRVLDDPTIQAAKDEPPPTTRAALRGRFIRQAKARRRDYTVDWVHLKLNDQAQRTVLCKDPFRRGRARRQVDRLDVSGIPAPRGGRQ